MASPGQVEQDYNVPKDGNELPTYDDLAAQGGPNSRFGRWRGWIEKRAAERYYDITPAERQRRRERGWGNEQMEQYQTSEAPRPSAPVGLAASPSDVFSDNRAQHPAIPTLHVSTGNLDYANSEYSRPPTPPPAPLPPVSTTLTPTHLKLNQFGSRFLPHSTAPIRCLLPLASDRYLLIGHDEGLSVLDMFPQEWAPSGGLAMKGSDDAQSRPIWTGQGVYQMTLLEVEQGDGTQQGVVLFLVGPEGDSCRDRETESRSIRMYNLASITSLAKWAISQRGANPLDLRASSNTQHTPTKRHRPQSSIARSIKSLIDHQTPEAVHHTNHLSPSTPSGGRTSPVHSLTPRRHDSDESTWDMVVDDLPLRWAADYVALAAAGTRLASSSVLSYALWNGDNIGKKAGRMLAIATKTNILLYETPRGERAFRFVKEFYTPLQPRNISFFQQAANDVTRRTSEAGYSNRQASHHRTESTSAFRPTSSQMNYGPQLSLFVIFDKKAGWIRLADSAVGEIEWYDDGSLHPALMHPSLSMNTIGASPRKSSSRFSTFEGPSLTKWTPLIQCELPLSASRASVSGVTTKTVHLLTKGRQTQILPSPLPMGASAVAPLHTVNWKHMPSSIHPRVIDSSSIGPILQLVSLGSHGLEVQEMTLGFLSKGKGKAPADETLWAEEDLGGDTGFLCTAGHWDDNRFLPFQELSRTMSTASDMSGFSALSMSSDDIVAKIRKQEGMYAWCKKGEGDYRVFWVGGGA